MSEMVLKCRLCCLAHLLSRKDYYTNYKQNSKIVVVVAQLVSATVHWVTQSSLGFESLLEPPTVWTLRGGR